MVNSEFNFQFMASWQMLALTSLSYNVLELLMAPWLSWHLAKAASVRPLLVPAVPGSSVWARLHFPGRNLPFHKWYLKIHILFCRGIVWNMSLGVLCLCPYHLHNHDEPDSQVVSHVLWSSTLGNISTGLACYPATEASQDPSRVSTRDLLLHYNWYCHLVHTASSL